MSDETPTERRLRGILIALDPFTDDLEVDTDKGAIDAGREAIALLREHSAIATNATWAAKRRDLLKRCEE